MRMSEAVRARVKQLAAGGATTEEIACHLALSAATVGRVLKREGVRRPRGGDRRSAAAKKRAGVTAALFASPGPNDRPLSDRPLRESPQANAAMANFWHQYRTARGKAG